MVQALAVLALIAAPAQAQSVQVNIVCHLARAEACAIKGTLRAAPVGARRRPELKLAEATFERGRTVTLELARGLVWELSVEATGWWSATVPVYLGDTASSAVLDVWPESRLKGKLQVPRGESMPAELTLRFAAPTEPKLKPDRTVALPSAAGKPGGDEVCAVEGGAFSCPLPATRLDLKLRARGFISRFYWARSLPAGGDLDLGDVALEPGASLVGLVTTADGPAKPDTCAVTIAPLTAGGLPLPESPRNAARNEESRPDHRGFFSFNGVAPGIYQLEARASGYAPARLAPIEVQPRTEATVREPIVLERPAELVVQVRPAVDAYGKAWALEVAAMDLARGVIEPLFTTPVDQDGRLRRLAMPVGSYRAVLHDSNGATFMAQVFDLTPTSPPVLLEPKLVPVRGKVLLGDRPLSARLWFGGQTHGVSVPMVTEKDGKFDGVLPSEGKWRVEIETEEPKLHRTLAGVEVRVSPSLGVAEVELRLPGTRIAGVVVDEAGSPVQGATVEAVDAAPTALLRATSDAEGGFEVLGLAVGPARVRAHDVTSQGPRSSVDQMVVLAEKVEATPLRLVLTRTTEVVLHVVAESGEPVSAALVYLLSRPRQSVVPQGSTDSSGTIHLDVPARIPDWDAVVMATGYALQAASLHVTGPTEASVDVVRYGGSLDIDLAAPMVADDPSQPVLVVQWDAVQLYGSLLLGWAQFNGRPADSASTHLSLPSMGSGNYRVCLIPWAALLTGASGAPQGSTPCAEGFLPPLGRLTLALPRQH